MSHVVGPAPLRDGSKTKRRLVAPETIFETGTVEMGRPRNATTKLLPNQVSWCSSRSPSFAGTGTIKRTTLCAAEVVSLR